jgi:hypothetical protein
MIVNEPNAFMTSSLFENSVEHLFGRAINERRDQYDSTGKVVLLMNGLGFVTRRRSA